jgi:hypothetical protein
MAQVCANVSDPAVLDVYGSVLGPTPLSPAHRHLRSAIATSRPRPSNGSRTTSSAPSWSSATACGCRPKGPCECDRFMARAKLITTPSRRRGSGTVTSPSAHSPTKPAGRDGLARSNATSPSRGAFASGARAKFLNGWRAPGTHLAALPALARRPRYGGAPAPCDARTRNARTVQKLHTHATSSWPISVNRSPSLSRPPTPTGAGSASRHAGSSTSCRAQRAFGARRGWAKPSDPASPQARGRRGHTGDAAARRPSLRSSVASASSAIRGSWVTITPAVSWR